jgi:3-oxoadipate enol-lactonase
MSRLRCGQIELAYEVSGQGPPLLLLSGLGLSSRVWSPILHAFEDQFRVLTVDNRGTGGSDAPPGPYAIEEMADDVASLLDQLEFGPGSAIGWSLGGSVLQSLLVRAPSHFHTAVLLSSLPSYTEVQHAWLDAQLVMRRQRLAPQTIATMGLPWSFTPRLLCDHARVASQVAALCADPNQTGLEAFEAQAAAIRAYDSRESLVAVKARTLVIVGAEDVLTPVEQAVELARCIPNSVLKVLPRGGHAMVLEYPDDTIDAIMGFLLA